jgi:imidazolonepropionase-like amidohydrolase
VRAVLLLLASAAAAVAQVTTAPVQGIRENDPRVHALTNARVITAPGKVIEKGTVLIRDGLVADVGPAVKVPAEARVWDLTGRTIYAGFIDSYSRFGLPETLQPEPLRPIVDHDNPDAKPKEVPSEQLKGTRSWNPRVTPERRAADFLKFDNKAARTMRELGFTTALVVPARGIFRGSSALLNLQDADPNRMIVAPVVAQHVSINDFERGRDAAGYPNSLMGAIALVRQTFLDAGWFQAAQDAYRKAPATTERPEANASLAALAEHAQRKQPTVFEAEDELDLLRALRVADEMKLQPVLLGNGFEYRVRQLLAERKAPIILPLDFPKAPEVEKPELAVEYQLDELQHWDRAPSNPALMAQAGIPFAFTTAKLDKPQEEFWSRLRLAVRRGLPREAALAALTTTPAEILGVGDRLGTIAPGRIANLVIADGDLFGDEARVLTTWVDGRWYDSEPAARRDIRGTWELAVGGKTWPLVIAGELQKLESKIGEERAHVVTQRDEVLLVVPARVLGGGEGGVRLSGRIVGDAITGTGSGPAGDPIRWSARQTAPHVAKPRESSPLDAPLDFPQTFPAGAFGRTAPPEQPGAVLIHGATIWTAGPQGTLENADLLVTRGKITAVGAGLKAPAGATAVDGKGLHITPGIVDCHSHAATSGGVNEASHSVTCEVRIGDVIDPTDIGIYQQLAGGVTTVNVLHGSANTIGGQNQVLKYRWGGFPEELKFADAPPGVKFALGENVKQSNWGEKFTTRYPQTRMGVEQIIRDRFRAAQEYEARWKRKEGLPPRRDLQLEALAEIVSGKRLIHCHSYRQDEVLAFLNLMKEFNVRPATLQHILEGYKVAPEIAQAGVGASTFADWWAFKMEAFDAVPENAAMMHSQQVLSSVNSDSHDLARRLNTEAAKSMKHGGMSPEDALKLVTLWPAQQLRIDKWVGSLEAGKDADFVIWSGHPMSNYSRALQTWVDGRKYFDRVEDAEAQKQFAAQREALVQKALGERVKDLGRPKEEKKQGEAAEDAAPEPPGRSRYRAAGEHYSCSDH